MAPSSQGVYTFVLDRVHLDAALDQIEWRERGVGDTTAEDATEAAEGIVLHGAILNLVGCGGSGGRAGQGELPICGCRGRLTLSSFEERSLQAGQVSRRLVEAEK